MSTLPGRSVSMQLLDLTFVFCSFQTSIPDSDYTFKNYYFPTADLSDDDETQDPPALKVKQNIAKRNIDCFFEKPKKKRVRLQSSNIAQANGEGTSYISSNNDDGSSASHLIKIEVYEMKKLKDVQPIDYWKYADVRVKYYASEDDKHYRNVRDLIYNITKQVATKTDCTKYYITADKK